MLTVFWFLEPWSPRRKMIPRIIPYQYANHSLNWTAGVTLPGGFPQGNCRCVPDLRRGPQMTGHTSRGLHEPAGLTSYSEKSAASGQGVPPALVLIRPARELNSSPSPLVLHPSQCWSPQQSRRFRPVAAAIWILDPTGFFPKGSRCALSYLFSPCSYPQELYNAYFLGESYFLFSFLNKAIFYLKMFKLILRDQ